MKYNAISRKKYIYSRAVQSNLDRIGGHHAEQNKPETDGQIQDNFSYYAEKTISGTKK